ncbi:hypothetical protein AAHA92_02325 [Salvia divinorum]|uniref:Potassium channel n=1 Tax=Salvia divinorum TaxID=28513 RepID=A0ABD1IGT8_SALDI
MESLKKISFKIGHSEEDGSSHGREEYMVQDLRERIQSSRSSRLTLVDNDLELDFTRRRFSLINGLKGLSQGLFIHPDNRWYKAWEKFILIWAIYSSFFTPMEFGFFRGLPENLFILDIVGQVAFLFDIILQFFVAYRDSHSYKMIYKHNPIALRYVKSYFFPDLLACMPWDIIYKACGRKEEVRYLLWIRLIRARRLTDFFQRMEKDIRINYLFTRIVKLIAVELYCTHTAACIFYYLATMVPKEKEGYTWIGSLKLGDYSYSHFREIDIWTRYTTSMYFAIVTMATVGYGDIHAVNLREMIFVMIYVSFDMILGAYLIGNMTALIVKGSKTVRYRDKMTDLTKYMNRHRLGKELRNQIKGHLRLQYESSHTNAAVLQDIPMSIRAKVTRVHEEFFLPGEVIMEQGNVVDQLYFVCHGVLEEVVIGADGLEETVSLLEPNSSFGEISILCNIPQPYTVRVCELCRLLRIDKQSFSNILEICFHDGRKVLTNLLEGKESNIRLKQVESDITFHIGKQEVDLALRLNSAAFYGDLYQLKSVIRSGADPNKKDYDGRTALHLAASKGYEDITLFLIQERVDINAEDNFGNTPLLEAIKNGHDRVASLLSKEGAILKIDNAGSYLCSVVARGDSDFLRRLLSNGMDPNSKDYDHRTPLHVAASQGLYLMGKLLVEAGASVLTKDRWGNSPIDEGRICGNKNMIRLLEEAKATQLLDSPRSNEATAELTHAKRKCTVFAFHPWDPKEGRKHGVVMWVPHSMEELIEVVSHQLGMLDAEAKRIILSEDGGQILEADMITDGQKLYLIYQTP